MSAPTVDITNLDTSRLKPMDRTDVFHQEAIQSSKNIFNIAERSLKENPNLSKVIIMEHPPRFDMVNVDPTFMKPKLARVANGSLGQMWLSSKLKDKISIGHHSLESSGSGSVHSNSVKTILMTALPKLNSVNSTPECGPAQSSTGNTFQQAKSQRRQYHPSVQIRNRFDVLNQGNL